MFVRSENFYKICYSMSVKPEIGRLPVTILEHLVKLFYIYVHVRHEYHLRDTDFALLFHKAVIHEVGESLGIRDEAHCPQ